MGYLIQTDDGTNILIDTGFPSQFELPGGAGLRLDHQNYIVHQLARVAIQPQDIHYLVCTHFDPDHAGGHHAFPSAELIVQRRHYATARTDSHPRFERMREHWDHPRLHYRQIDGDMTLVPGVDLIETSSHVPGHQSVLVRLPEIGPVLLTIDAVTQASQFDPDTCEIGPNDMDAVSVRASTRKLVDLARREQVALVVFDHDAAQWPQLKKLPEYYA